MKKHALSGIIGDRHRQIIHAVVDEIYAKPDEGALITKLLPIRNVPASILINERLAGFGGLTGERVMGEKGKAINAGSSQVRYFKPGAYQEHVLFNEDDLLKLRKYGSLGERGATGLTSGELDEMSRSAMKLKLRVQNRIQKLSWEAIFDGTYTYKSQVFSFEKPGGNTLAAATDWSNTTTGKPFKDLRVLISTNAKLRKYKIKAVVINPKTETDMLNTDEAKDLVKNNYAAIGDVNKIAQILYPGLPEIIVDRSVYQEESLSSGGEIVLADAQFFVPDDKILFIPEMSGTLYPAFGEFDLAENMNDPSATLDQPAVGIYTFVDEKGLEERENPHAKIVSGFNGAPNLLRPNDVFVATC